MKKMLNHLIKWFLTYFTIYYLILLVFLCVNSNIPSDLEEKIAAISFLISLGLYILITNLINYIVKKENETVKKVSKKYSRLIELNSRYEFKDLGKIKRVVIEKEYSRKSYDRARANSILLYRIENNEDNIREFILDAYRNKRKYDAYLEEFSKIDERISDNELEQINYSRKKYNKIENRIIKEKLYKENVFNVSINVIVSYTTASGKNTYKKNRIVPYQELCDLYMQWRNGKKYEETSRRERKYMTNEMRYDVLKRDNFKCQKCGITAKDGAKLHVDHIIPVSKGGKTTLSNLQTLCDRCNLGKSNKDN